PLDSVTGANLPTVGPAVRFVISSDSSHHSITNAPRAEVDFVIRSVVPLPVTTEAVITTSVAYVFPVPVPRVTNKVTPQIRDMDYEELFTEFNFETAHQACLSAEVDSAAGGGHDAEIEFVTTAEHTVTGSVAAERPKRPRKKRPAATDASGSSHPPKKLRGDYGTSNEVVIGGKSPSALKELLASSILSAEADYLTALGAAIIRAIEKEMQSGLAARIDHDKVGRNMTDVAAYNPDAKADFNSALQELRGGPLADAPGMSDLQPDFEQLRVPIHRSEDQVVLGETSLSFTFSVSHSRMEPIRENIAAQRSAFIDVPCSRQDVPIAVPELVRSFA
nr:hypothetical protein [Tanacetum cinerariifolium]